jgi:hypothetical protein
MKPSEFISEANYIFHPVIVSKLQVALWKILGILAGLFTFVVLPIIFYSAFFDRAEYLNRKKMYQLLAKSPSLLKDPRKVRVGIMSGYLWQIDLRTDVCWTEDGVFCACNENILFCCTILPDKLQKKYDLKMRRLLKISLKQYRKEKKAVAK